jgi:hypothetical protein
MKAKERREIIQVLEDSKAYLIKHLGCDIFLCQMKMNIGKRKFRAGIHIECGYNDRMIPQALSYLKSQKPTSRLNKEHYNAPYYDQESGIDDSWWQYSYDAPVSKIDMNNARVRFLEHLINKLKR